MNKLIISIVLLLSAGAAGVYAQQVNQYDPWIWVSEPPGDCPFEQSSEIVGVALTMNYRHYKLKIRGTWGDTWYPTWASNDTLYSSWTDGQLHRLDGSLDFSQSGWINYDKEMVYKSHPKLPLQATTGQAVMVGNDPLDLHTYSLGTQNGDPVTYLKDFGEQAYFLNFPSKFISTDGKKLWLCYSGNFANGWNGMAIMTNPPGSGYGLVMQEMILLDKESYKKYRDNPAPVIKKDYDAGN
jgi:hypothetical protein